MSNSLAEQKRLPELNDFYQMRYVSTPDYHPASGWLAYVISCPKKEKYIDKVYIKNIGSKTGEGAPGENTGTAADRIIRITAGGDVENNPRISADGRQVLFLSNVTGDAQIWIWELDTGHVRQMTTMRYSVSNPVWSPDSRRISYLCAAPQAVDPRLWCVLRTPEMIAEEERIRRSEPMATEEFGYKSDEFMGFTSDVPPTHVWTVNLSDGRMKCLTDREKRHVMQVWSPDGRYLAFVSNRERQPGDFLGMDLYTVPSDGGEIIRLTEDCFVAYYPKKIAPRYTPDGSHIVFGALKPSGQGFPPCYLFKVNVASKEVSQVFEENGPCYGATRFLYNAERYGNSYETMQVSDDGAYAYFISGQHGAGNIYRVNLDGDPHIETITDKKANYAALTPIIDYKTVVTKADTLHSEYVVLLDLKSGEEQLLVDENGWMGDKYISDMQELWINTHDRKTKIQGWIIPPQNREAGKTYPAVLYIHGGPTPFYGYAMTWEYQCLAAAGIGVILCNPRGSTGYGDYHGLISLAFDGTAAHDLLQYVDAAAEAFDWIDSERIGVCGGSYGGYMTNWLAGRSKRFKAAATHRSIANYLFSYASADDHSTSAAKAPSFEAFMLEQLEKSPVTYSDQIDIPFLILHSTQDMRCPVENAHQLYTAVKDQHPKLPVRMVLFPKSNHGLLGSGPMHLQLRHMQENIDWLKKHL